MEYITQCDYDIEHRSAKHIKHVDYISCQSLPPSINEDDNSDYLLVQPPPVSRQTLIEDTRRYLGAVVRAIKTG